MSRMPTLIIPMCLGFIIGRAVRNENAQTFTVAFLAFIADIVYIAAR